MNKLNLDNRRFRVKSNATNGETGQETMFLYHQNGDMIWADYAGGNIKFGHLLGKMNTEGHAEFVYHHINIDGKIKTGKCVSVPTIMPDGLICLNEKWEWTCDDFSKGVSVLIEM